MATRLRIGLRGIVAGIVVLGVLYLGIAGLVLARIAGGILTPGPLAAQLAAMPAPSDPLALGFRGDPGVALGLPFSTVPVPTPLGPAPAWLVPGEPDAEVWAIYVHGIAGLRENGYRHLSVLHGMGVPVLLISYRNDAGAPADPGGAYAFGLTEWRDLEAAVDLVAAMGASRVIVVAESMGGGIAGQFLRQSDRAQRVAALALDSPALSFSAVLAHVASGIGMPAPRAVARVANLALAWGGPADLRGAEVVQAVAAFPGPVFLAHGTGDRVVPVGISDDLLRQRRGETVHLRGSADHLLTWAEDPAGYADAFGRFVAPFAPR
jgi:pimeloyl-ACP methyl ester carboxylesterase